MSTSVFLLLGSNQGDARLHLTMAKAAVIKNVGRLLKESSLYQTSAWGKTDQPDFLNQVIEISYEGDPFLLLKSLLDIESKMGRVRIEKWGTRIIDIDILFYGNTIVNGSDLRVPHPQIPYRRFTLIPLVEIAPDFIHPVLHQSNTQLLHECTDLLEVKKLSL
jgi:2-amino-4-hydroxy-6-hydroxymethyldihydropteridine diphosphokinase